jgi:SAM-dependent methyltransferase
MLIGRMPDARMLIAGQPHPEVPVDSMLDDLGLRDKIFLLGHLSEENLDGYISACDVVLNLRWPSFGETSGITARAFGLGKTVVMSDTGAAREYPDDICVRIPGDLHLETVLRDTLEWLLSSPDIVSAIGCAAAKWAADTCGWPAVAQGYADFARSYAEPLPARTSMANMPANMPAPQIREYLWRWVEPGTDRARYLDDHETRLSRTLQLIPPGTAEDRILEMGCYLQITPALSNLLGYGEVRGSYLGSGGSHMRMATARDGETLACTIDLFDCERDTFPYSNGFFATVLCCELLEHLRHDPMRMMGEIYRILRDGGILVLTTPNIVSLRALNAIVQGNHPGFYNRYPDPHADFAEGSKHEREYTPVEISRLLEAAGFIVEHIETESYGGRPTGTELAERVLSHLGLSPDLRGDCILAVARKEALPRDPRPSWLYDAAVSRAEVVESGEA